MGKKATKVVSLDRTMEVYRLLRSGASRTEILLYAERMWKISHASADKYINKANAIHKQTVLPTIEEFQRDAAEKLDMLYTDNYLQGDNRECRMVLSTKNEILGFKKVNVAAGGTIDDILKKLKEDEEEEIENNKKK